MRIYKEMLYDLYVLLVWLRFHVKGDLKTVYTQINQHYKAQALPPEVANGLRYAQVGHLDSHMETDNLIENLGKMIVSERNSGLHEGDLIDLIIKQMNLPFVGNALNGAVLKVIAKALIDPSEMANLKALLEKRELACNACGRVFQPKESAVVSNDGYMNMLYCSICLLPASTRCKHCGDSVPHFSAYTNNMGDSCDFHKKKAEVKKKKVVVNADLG